MDPAVATWTGEARREQVALLGMLSFLALENLRDAHVLFRMFKKVSGGHAKAGRMGEWSFIYIVNCLLLFIHFACQYRQEKGISKQSLTFEFMDRLLLTSVRDARQLFQVHLLLDSLFAALFISMRILLLLPVATIAELCMSLRAPQQLVDAYRPQLTFHPVALQLLEGTASVHEIYSFCWMGFAVKNSNSSCSSLYHTSHMYYLFALACTLYNCILLAGPIAKKLFGIQAPPNIMSMMANMFSSI